jgi:hypothetical protein
MIEQEVLDKPFHYERNGYKWDIYSRDGVKIAEVEGYLEEGKRRTRAVIAALNLFFSDERLEKLMQDNEERTQFLQRTREMRKWILNNETESNDGKE